MSTTDLEIRPSIGDWARSATRQLCQLLGDDLVASYLIGSGALGGFMREQSDVDLVAVCAKSPSDERKQAIIDLLTREAMTWPVRGLEFVSLVESALAVRHGAASTTLDPARVERFTRGVRVRIERASRTV